MAFQLTLNFGEDGANALSAAGMRVCVAQNVCKQPLANDIPPVAWICYAPSASVSVLSWDDSYFIYESATSLTVGASIQIGTELAAQSGASYTYTDGAFYIGQGSAPDHVDVVNNQSGGGLSFGLAQQVSVDNRLLLTPINVAPVPFSHTASFRAPNTLSVFVAACTGAGGIVLSQVPGNACIVTFSPINNVAMNFSAETMAFSINHG